MYFEYIQYNIFILKTITENINMCHHSKIIAEKGDKTKDFFMIFTLFQSNLKLGKSDSPFIHYEKGKLSKHLLSCIPSALTVPSHVLQYEAFWMLE